MQHRALSLYLPHWAVELVRRRDQNHPDAPPTSSSPGEALILVRTERQRPVVAACCEIARRAGVLRAMTAADARALIPGGRVRLEEHRADRDAPALESLARWATRFSPLVAPDPPDGLMLNISGCARVFRGERRLLNKLLADVQRLGFTGRAAIAPTFGAAWALARCSPKPAIVDGPGLRDALAPLPVGMLRLDEDIVDALDEVGVSRVGELLGLARETLPSRFGPDLLLRVDQALGHALETIEPVRPREPIRAERALDGPTTSHETLAIVVRGLLDLIVRELSSRQAGVRRLDAIFDRPRLEAQTLVVSLGRPSRDGRHLWSLIRPRMERMNLGDGVERIELHAARWSRVRDEQMACWGGSDAPTGARELAQLCDTIANRIGHERVRRVHLADSHIPERAWETAPVPNGPQELRESSASRGEQKGRSSSTASPRPLCARPTILFHPPEPIRTIAGAGDAPPWRVRWRAGDSTIITSIGPERIGEPWWDTPAGPRPEWNAARDYFRVQDEGGRWLWVFRQTGTSRWFIHGLWA